jgi:hypothetical protein
MSVSLAALRIFFFGMFIWALPGVIPPFLGGLGFVGNILDWICHTVAVICFLVAFLKARAAP